MRKILITGHCGLIGNHLLPALRNNGFDTCGIDIADHTGDITNRDDLAYAIENCDGIVHLAAVSRVIFGQNDPEKCWNTNVIGSQMLLESAVNSAKKPWVLVSSSREVYGEPEKLPVVESSPLNPVNIYGESKLAMETLTLKARNKGINTAIVRLANVYGCIHDHHDRVLPAFCRNAVEGQPLRIDGGQNIFDFTHVTDTVDGILRLITLLEDGVQEIPPIHLLPGHGTSLFEAANIAVNACGSQSHMQESPPRQYDVSRFIGDPTHARELLGWQAKILPNQGITQLVHDFMNIKYKKTA